MIGIELAHEAVARNNFDQSLFATNSFEIFFLYAPSYAK